MSKHRTAALFVFPCIVGCSTAPAPTPAPEAVAAAPEAPPPSMPVDEAPPAPAAETAAAAPAEVPPARPEPVEATAGAQVVLLVQTTGEGWTAPMRQRAEDMLRLRIGADERFHLLPQARVDALGERAQRSDLLSPEWLQGVGESFADLGQVVFLRAALQLEQLSSQDAEGRPLKTPKLTVALLWSDLAGGRRAEFTTAGHLLTNDKLIAAAVSEFQSGVLAPVPGPR